VTSTVGIIVNGSYSDKASFIQELEMVDRDRG
jgi:hypothetical protein